MGVYKELAHEIESLGKQQKRIYSDAADFGIPIKSKSDPLLKQFVKIINEAKESFKIKRTPSKYGTGQSVDVSFTIPWEQDEGMYVGTKYTLGYVETFKPWSAYLTIYSERSRTKESPFVSESTSKKIDKMIRESLIKLGKR